MYMSICQISIGDIPVHGEEASLNYHWDSETVIESLVKLQGKLLQKNKGAVTSVLNGKSVEFM